MDVSNISCASSYLWQSSAFTEETSCTSNTMYQRVPTCEAPTHIRRFNTIKAAYAIIPTQTHTRVECQVTINTSYTAVLLGMFVYLNKPWLNPGLYDGLAHICSNFSKFGFFMASYHFKWFSNIPIHHKRSARVKPHSLVRKPNILTLTETHMEVQKCSPIINATHHNQ